MVRIPPSPPNILILKSLPSFVLLRSTALKMVAPAAYHVVVVEAHCGIWSPTLLLIKAE